LTEFIPVSSSGHLVLAHRLLGTNLGAGELVFDVAVHLGTLAAVLVYFRADVVKLFLAVGRLASRAFSSRSRREALSGSERLFLFVVLAIVPTACIGLGLQGQLERLHAERGDALVLLTAGLLVANGVLLIASDRLKRGGKSVVEIPLYAALAVGIAQGLAVMPGISRSGATVLAALAIGFSRSESARVSFLCAIPAIAGAGLAEVALSREGLGLLEVGPVVVGGAAAFGVGLGAIFILITAVKRAKLRFFGIYCTAVGVLTLVVAA